ncbi:MAG: ferritin-like domain-containing protein [Desulfovibrionales bacterium]
MEKKDIIKQLSSLAQLDVDAFHAYEQAIRKIDHEGIRKQLSLYQSDHRRHYDELSRTIQNMGGKAPKFSKDFKGYVIQGMTSLQSATGIKSALKSMETNEKLTNKKYEQASSNSALPKDIHELLVSFYQDERNHLSFIQQALKEKIWETTPA